MPRRSRRRKQIDVETIQALQEDFSTRFKEPKEQKGLKLRDVVSLMQDQLRDALRKHWSYQDCCELLAEKNIHISPSTLQQYLRELSQDSHKTTKQNGKRNSDEDGDVQNIFAETPVESSTEDTEVLDKAKRFNTLDRSSL